MIVKIYNNQFCHDYNQQNCYLIYTESAGIYISTENDTFRLLQKPTFDLTVDNIDTYAEARNFTKVLEYNNYKLTWYNKYDEKSPEIKEKITKIKTRLYIKLKSDLHDRHQFFLAYAALKSIESNIEVG